MLAFLDPIRDLTDWAVVLRMLLSAAAGGPSVLRESFAAGLPDSGRIF